MCFDLVDRLEYILVRIFFWFEWILNVWQQVKTFIVLIAMMLSF